MNNVKPMNLHSRSVIPPVSQGNDTTSRSNFLCEINFNKRSTRGEMRTSLNEPMFIRANISS